MSTSETVGLTVWGQFGWGSFGGAMISIFTIVKYAQSLPDGAMWPKWSFKTCVGFCLLALLPPIAGLVSIMCASHYPLLAAFEGASAPMLFFFVAEHCGFVKSGKTKFSKDEPKPPIPAEDY